MKYPRPNTNYWAVETSRPNPGTHEVKAADSRRADTAATRLTAYKKLACILLLAVSYTVAWSSAVRPQHVTAAYHSLFRAEHALHRVPAHISEFGPASSALALPRCGDVRPPEALLTPDPLLPAADESLLVRVSFIVGSDGHVYSAFVLNSAGPDDDQAVLRTMRQWRYRPALCNGVPTDFEARVRFSIP